MLGATLGIILMLPFNGMTTGTQNQVTFSEVVFSLQMTPAVVLSAVIFALDHGRGGRVRAGLARFAPRYTVAPCGIRVAPALRKIKYAD